METIPGPFSDEAIQANAVKAMFESFDDGSEELPEAERQSVESQTTFSEEAIRAGAVKAMFENFDCD